jgi:TonB-dependent SusC/RagA subfamily outer membrane receptor
MDGEKHGSQRHPWSQGVSASRPKPFIANHGDPMSNAIAGQIGTASRLLFCSGAFLLSTGCHQGRAGVATGPATGSVGVEIGYGTRDRREVTGAVTVVTDEQISEQRTLGLAGILQQRVPGLRVVRLASGEMSIEIRGAASFNGSNEPLIVIDGRPSLPRELFLLTPAELRSVAVVKDATAAIYGSRAANGVVIVTTRRAR